MISNDFRNFLSENIKQKLFSAVQYSSLKNGSLLSGCAGTFDFTDDEKVSNLTQFDLASLTKVILTLPLFYSLISKRELFESEDISAYFGTNFLNITVLELLNHTSGLPAWLPFYRLIDKNLPLQERKDEVKRIALSQNHSIKSRCYSDLNYLLLGFILEKVFDSTLDKIFDDFKQRSLLNGEITFLPQKKTPKTAFSEERNSFPDGRVEDENSYFLSSFTAHAGLFGSAASVVKYFDNLLKTEWFLPVAQRLNFAGFDRPEGSDSNYGKKAKSYFIGHLGFTGTALLIDPRTGRVAALFTNSTHPTPDKPQRKERMKLVRQRFFDLFFS